MVFGTYRETFSGKKILVDSTNFFSLSLFGGDIFVDLRARYEIPDATRSRDTREIYSWILVPSPAIRFKERSSLSLSLVHSVIFLSHTCLLLSSLRRLVPSLCPQVFLPRRCFLSPSHSSFPPQIRLFRSPFLLSADNLFFFPPFPAVATSACHVTRNRSMGFETSTSRCPRKARTERERSSELPTRSNGLPRVRSPIQSPIHAPTRTRAQGGGRGEIQREREKERLGPVSCGEREIEGANDRKGENEGTGKRERVKTKEAGKANDQGRT